MASETKLERELQASVVSLAKRAAELRELASESDTTDDIGLSIDSLVAHVEKVHAVARRVMKEGHHFGTVPGAGDRKCLLKPGAELLTLTFKLDPQFHLDERWDGDQLEAVVTCTLFHAPTGNRLGSGIGSCSTRESKYYWRKGERKCPTCGAGAITPSKYEDTGWFCFAKKGGCNAKFAKNDPAITSQQIGRVPNPDIADLYNTVRKIGCKRAHVAAVLFVTGASEVFTQDMDDTDEHKPEHRRTPDISPHLQDRESFSDPAPPDSPAPGFCRELEEIDATIRPFFRQKELSNGELQYLVIDGYDPAKGYDTVLAARERLGSRAKQSPLTAALQKAREQQAISPREYKDTSALWAAVSRRLEKLEAIKPPAEASFVDEDPEDFDRSQ